MEDNESRRSPRRQRLSDEALDELLTKARHGEPEAVYTLFRYFSPLWRRAIRLDRWDAELYQDLEGEIYVIFHGLIQGFHPERQASLFTYLATYLPLKVQSYVARYHRERGREALEGEQIERLERPVDLENPEQLVLLRISLRGAIASLTDEQRDVVRLHVFEDRSWEEVAAILGKSAAACRQAYHRALAKLRKELTKDS